MSSVKFGIVGAGEAASFHTQAFRERPHAKAEFVSVYDVNRVAAEQFAEWNNFAVYSDLDAFLKSDMDAVLVAVPHSFHAEITKKVAEAGKHVLCEKPMAMTLEECDEMISAARRANVKLMIAENHRFLPVHRKIRQLIEEGYVGSIYLGRTYEGAFCAPEKFLDPDNWNFTYAKGGGGVLADQGVHKFAMLNWLLDSEVDTGMAWLGKAYNSPATKGEDNAMMLLQYRSGAMMEVVVSSTTVHPLNNNTELHGTKGHIMEDHSWQKPIRIFTSHPGAKQTGEYYEIGDLEHGAYPAYYIISAFHEDSHFAECILNDSEPEFTPEQAKEAVAIVLLGYLSAKNGSPTKMSELKALVGGRGTGQVLEGLEQVVRKNFQLLQWK